MKLSRLIDNATDYAWSWIQARRQPDAFAPVQTLCLFIGYRRSGHSLVGACLDAHPNMCFAHELGALRYLKAGFSQNQLFHLILKNSREQAQRSRSSTGYKYDVPGQWQGRTQDLQVIGDKQGGQTAVEFEDHPESLDLLLKKTSFPLKFIHVTRNPYDNAAAISVRSKIPLDQAIDSYLRKCGTVEWLASKLPAGSILDLQLEQFIDDPKTELPRICTFLGQETTPDYLEACARIVLEKPNLSRRKVEWSEADKARITEGISRYPFLSGYSFES